ncbi:Phosphate-repressible phosphate permease pho-4 [Colletotrichum sp. SAR 10_99]|nr:Phosphate-repressible phosphate permease pho-4 [Colletotrichum sp. SAR 10_99]
MPGTLAMVIATFAEFGGSVSIGSRVADTIRNRIIDPHLYDDRPSVLLLVMMCAIFGSSVFLSVATRNGLPISTTHSIIGGIVGAATASVGIGKISWGWNVLMAWKGVQTEVELTPAQILIAVFSVATGATSLQAFFILPYLWRKIVNEDWQLEWIMMWKGPWLLNRPPPPPPPPGVNKINIKDYYRGHLTADELAYVRASETLLESIQTSQTPSDLFKDEPVVLLSSPALALPQTPSSAETVTSRRSSEDIIPPRPAGPWNSLPVLLWRLNRLVLRGLEKDVVTLQKRNALLSWDIEDMHARAPHYDNRAEYMYSALQILTASTASFIHGANDVANSIGPFATAYDIWRSGRVETAVGVPLWILCFGGGAIVDADLAEPRVRDGAGERDYGADGNAAGVAGVDDAVYRGRDGGCWACEWGLEVY